MTGQTVAARRLGGWRRVAVGLGTFGALFVAAFGLAHVLPVEVMSAYFVGAAVFSLALAVFIELDRWRLDVPLAVLVAVGAAWPLTRPAVIGGLALGIVAVTIRRLAGGVR